MAVGPKVTDPRFVRSRNALLDAVTGLIDGGPIDDISITRIVDAAGVSRPTFYQHFNDVPGAARAAALRRLVKAFPPSAPAATELGPADIRRRIEAAVLPVFRHLKHRRSFYRRVLESGANVAFFDDLVAFLADRMMIAGLTPRASTSRASAPLGVFLAGGAMWLVIRWIQSNNGAESPEDLAAQISEMIARAQIQARHSA